MRPRSGLRAGPLFLFGEGKVIRKSVQGVYSATLLRKRLFAAFAAVAFLFLAVCTRFFYVQILSGERLRGLALGQWTREIPVTASRGDIVDASGVLLAGSAAAYAVYVRPNAVRDKPHTAAVLAELFGLNEAELLTRLLTARVSEFALVRRADKEAVLRLEAYDLPGVYYARDDVRVYPFGSTLSRVIGFTSSDGVGLTGIEKYYDKYLRGENGEIAYPADLVGAEVSGDPAYYPAEDGLTVQLTVDCAIQAAAEGAMERVYAQYSPVTAQCIVLDPDTFDVLAMAESPSFDLNDVPRGDADLLADLSRNDLVSDIYEPGSTFKIVTAAANIEEYLRGNPAAFSRTHVFNSSRTRSVDGTTVRCWSTHANGRHSGQTLAEALNNSCNPCFTDIALALGTETFYEYLEKFHFGSATGIDFSGEAQGMLLPESAVRACDLARIGFGQTVAVTALQLACAGASAVNGGYYYRPRLVRAILSPEGGREEIEPDLLGRTVSEEASRILAGLLEGVVESGSGSRAYIEGYKVGGKTGTAQKFEGGALAQGKYVSSFLGFFPADDPQYLVLVIVDEPQGAYYGSVVAAPAAREVMQGIIDARGIRPYEG